MENIIEGLDNSTLTRLAEVTKLLEELKAEQDELKAEVMGVMKNGGVNKIDTDKIVVTYVAPSERENFDSKRLKEEDPDTYKKYTRISQVTESLKLKVKTILVEGK